MLKIWFEGLLFSFSKDNQCCEHKNYPNSNADDVNELSTFISNGNHNGYRGKKEKVVYNCWVKCFYWKCFLCIGN